MRRDLQWLFEMKLDRTAFLWGCFSHNIVTGIAYLSLVTAGIPYIRIPWGQHIKFHPYRYFKSFQEQPLTMLAFATSSIGYYSRSLLPDLDQRRPSLALTLTVCKNGLISHVHPAWWVPATVNSSNTRVESAIVYASNDSRAFSWAVSEKWNEDFLRFIENEKSICLFENTRK